MTKPVPNNLRPPDPAPNILHATHQGETAPVDMEIDEQREAIRNAIKRKRAEEQSATVITKSPYTGHANRKTLQKIRIDFLNVNNVGEALNKWRQVMETLKTIDPCLVIHHGADISKDITPQNKIPKVSAAAPYAKMSEFKHHKAQKIRYACITTVTTSRPISEYKRTNQGLVPKLAEHQVFLRPTTLDTADTVEVGFFVGLHPSLTNVSWRSEQILNALPKAFQKTPIQLYRRKLTEGNLSTSCLVLRCKKSDSTILETQLTTLAQSALGKLVEFVPYSLRKHLPGGSFRDIFSTQNQFIEELGVIPVKGLPRAVMEAQYGPERQPFHKWLTDTQYINSVEPSNTPTINKWWILIQKKNHTTVQTLLTTTIKDQLQTIHPTMEDYQADIQHDHYSDPIPPPTTHLTALMARLSTRTPSTPLLQPKTTGRNKPTYANATKHKQHSQQPTHQKVPIFHTVETVHTDPSTLTSLTQANHKTMMLEIQTMMKHMMEDMFKHMRELFKEIQISNNSMKPGDTPPDLMRTLPPKPPYKSPVLEKGQNRGGRQAHPSLAEGRGNRLAGRGHRAVTLQNKEENKAANTAADQFSESDSEMELEPVTPHSHFNQDTHGNTLSTGVTGI